MNANGPISITMVESETDPNTKTTIRTEDSGEAGEESGRRKKENTGT